MAAAVRAPFDPRDASCGVYPHPGALELGLGPGRVSPEVSRSAFAVRMRSESSRIVETSSAEPAMFSLR